MGHKAINSFLFYFKFLINEEFIFSSSLSLIQRLLNDTIYQKIILWFSGDFGALILELCVLI